MIAGRCTGKIQVRSLPAAATGSFRFPSGWLWSLPKPAQGTARRFTSFLAKKVYVRSTREVEISQAISRRFEGADRRKTGRSRPLPTRASSGIGNAYSDDDLAPQRNFRPSPSAQLSRTKWEQTIRRDDRYSSVCG